MNLKLNRDERTRILILAVQVPYSQGGAEVLVDGLYQQLKKRDYIVDVVSLPFSAYPNERLVREAAAWQNLDLTQVNGTPIDIVIPTKFPSYLTRHPRKRVWLVHQFRQMYDLQNTNFAHFGGNRKDEAIRDLLMDAETKALQVAEAVYTISGNVSGRLKQYLDIDSTPLHPPVPLGARYTDVRASQPPAEDPFFLCVGRVCAIKRPDLAIGALAHGPGRLKVVGPPDESVFGNYIRSEVDKHHLWDRVEFLGRVSDEVLIDLYSRAHGVVYAPFDEDYGYVTLEALASGCPVITARDSGAVTSFVRHDVNGVICEPTPQAIGEAYRKLLEVPEYYAILRRGAKETAVERNWENVIEALTGGTPPVVELPGNVP